MASFRLWHTCGAPDEKTAAIYSTDFSWAVGTAALNIGIESLVPSMIEPLFRAGEEEKQHGENGFFILNRFVDESDSSLVAQCQFYIEALSHSMAKRLLTTGIHSEQKHYE